MNWAHRRRIIIIGILVIVTASFIAMLTLVFTTENATCFDGEQNGVETGIDCGGGCELICTEEARPLSVLFSQYIKTNGRSDVIAHVANLNKNADAVSVKYTIEVFTEAGDLFAQHSGITDVPHESIRAIFVPQIASIAPEIARAFVTISEQTFLTAKNGPKLSAESFAWKNVQATPTLSVQVRGDEEASVRRTPLTVTIFDSENTVLAASNTIIDSIGVDAMQEVVFTWNVPFERTPTRIEFIFDTPRAYGER